MYIIHLYIYMYIFTEVKRLIKINTTGVLVYR